MIVTSGELGDDGLRAAVCIVGAGPAGITVARVLDAQGIDVLLLEAGTGSPTARPDFFAGESLSLPYPADVTRLSGIGGTSGHWAGVCRPFDEVTFGNRTWVGGGSWPLEFGDLDPYLLGAADVLDLFIPDGDDPWGVGGNTPSNRFLDPSEAAPVVFPVSPPTRFETKYRSELDRSSGITCVTDATVTSVDLDSSGRSCTGVSFRTSDGRSLVVSAANVILAAGAIETARLLLDSTAVVPEGVGNSSDLVGRYFMDHPILWRLPLVSALDDNEFAFFDLNQPDGETGKGWRGALVPRAEVQQREGILSSYFWFNRPSVGELPDDPVLTGVRYLTSQSDSARQATATIVFEQAPNPNSRVGLGTGTDEWGRTPAQVDWRFTDLDRHSVDATVALVGRLAGATGLGRLAVAPEAGSWFDILHEGVASHHIGTTRMAESMHEGVVGSDLAVHGVDGLSIVGSSVFPTGGHVNPTLTIVALALRLGEQLAETLS